MKVVGLCGASGSGKTTLAEGLIAALKAAARGCRSSSTPTSALTSTSPARDSFRHRAAGAYEVLVANSHRVALVREFESEREPDVHELIAQLTDLGDPVDASRPHWVLVEGFKHAELPKIEVWRAVRPADLALPARPACGWRWRPTTRFARADAAARARPRPARQHRPLPAAGRRPL